MLGASRSTRATSDTAYAKATAVAIKDDWRLVSSLPSSKEASSGRDMLGSQSTGISASCACLEPADEAPGTSNFRRSLFLVARCCALTYTSSHRGIGTPNIFAKALRLELTHEVLRELEPPCHEQRKNIKPSMAKALRSKRGNKRENT